MPCRGTWRGRLIARFLPAVKPCTRKAAQFSTSWVMARDVPNAQVARSTVFCLSSPKGIDSRLGTAAHRCGARCARPNSRCDFCERSFMSARCCSTDRDPRAPWLQRYQQCGPLMAGIFPNGCLCGAPIVPGAVRSLLIPASSPTVNDILVYVVPQAFCPILVALVRKYARQE